MRFDLGYAGVDGALKRPTMVHREAEAGAAAVRLRSGEDLKARPIPEVIGMIADVIRNCRQDKPDTRRAKITKTTRYFQDQVLDLKRPSRLDEESLPTGQPSLSKPP